MPVIPSTGSAKARVGYRALAYTGWAESLNVDPAFPIDGRLTELRYFQRSARGLANAYPSDFGGSGAEMAFGLDFGADVPVAALSFEHVNFPAMTIRYGTTANPNVGVYAENVASDGVDPEDGRQKVLVVPATAITLRYLFIVPDGVPMRGNAYAIGSLGAWGELQSLYKNPGTPYRKAYEDTYDGSTAPTRCRITFPARLVRSDLAAVEQFLAMARAPRERVMLWDENEGDLAKWYHVQRAGTAEGVRQAGPYLELTGLELREVGAVEDDG